MISLAIEASGGRREWRTDGGLTVMRCSEAAVASPRSCAASEVGEAGNWTRRWQAVGSKRRKTKSRSHVLANAQPIAH
jgi:hypothetical protein